ncbi:MAG: tetratricopeptide repeat protein [Oxalobacter sp.]|nr:tetratricopeptide repeat protein [Oxalobacter sp.]
MAFNLEEQEQIDSLKRIWKRYGNIATWALIVVLFIYAAIQGWNWYQRKQTAQASALYYEMQTAVLSGDSQKALQVAKDVQDKFSGTPYAPMITLVAAKMAYENNDAATAKAQLDWVTKNSSDDGYKALARVRLAGILLDEKAYDEALSALSGNVPDAFVALVEDRKGDIYLAQGKIDEAKAAYNTAYDKMAPENPGRQLVKLKLEEVGVDVQTKKASVENKG